MRTGLSELAVTLGLLLGVAGCQSSTAVNELTSISVIEELPSGEDAITVPNTAQAGQAFEVVITTTGRNGCVREGHTELEVDGSTAEITPYDITAERSDEGCTQALVRFTRTVEVTFDVPGVATVVVFGRSFTDSDIHRHEFQVMVEG